MIDWKLIEEKPDYVRAQLLKKGWDFEPEPVLGMFRRRRELLHAVEASKAEQNRLTAKVPAMKKAGEDPSPIFREVKRLAQENKDREAELVLPNLPDPDLLAGGKENNAPIREWGRTPSFSFDPKDHVTLAEGLGIIDYRRAAKISGSGTWIYVGDGARLEWALLNYFIAAHLRDGYTFILPPHLLNVESGYTSGQFPKFRDEVFYMEGMEPRKFLLPTAETALVNLHRNEILSLDDLPRKYFAYTPCYRKEAGSYRTEERGMIRGYQFNKVEMVQYTEEDKSDVAFDEMVRKAESLLQGLGLAYRLDKLAAGDCSHSMARTYDIEVWIPSMGIYKEVSSVSNARDYQARRGMVRYRDAQGKIHFCHTLNGSGLATSRVFPALLEQCQQEDGSILIPEALRPYMGGQERILPKK